MYWDLCEMQSAFSATARMYTRVGAFEKSSFFCVSPEYSPVSRFCEPRSSDREWHEAHEHVY